MSQEFLIKSTALEDKINQLLPSQGGLGAGVDLSASTQIVPIVDLTESAEGSNLRVDLQTSVDFATSYNQIVSATNTVIVNTTGFYRVDVTAHGVSGNTELNLFDGTTSKPIRQYYFGTEHSVLTDSFNVFLSAGLSLRASSSSSTAAIQVFTRQIADISGNLTNPLSF
jgi:hypothetical protein